MSDWKRVRSTPCLLLTLVISTALATPALPGVSVAETALQTALAEPTPAAPAVASAASSTVLPPATTVVASAPAPAPLAQTPARLPVPSVAAAPVQPAPLVKAAPTKATAPVKTTTLVKAAAKLPAKPAPSADQLRQKAIQQAQQVAPRRAPRSAVVHSTAYNSFAAQTDASPTITATGTRVRFGVLALSRDLLRQFPYGSKVRLEDLSGRYSRLLAGKVFVVEDTMHPRMVNTVDVWMPTMGQALQWGARTVRITAVQ